MDTNNITNAIAGGLSASLILLLLGIGISIIWVKILAWAITNTVLDVIEKRKRNGNGRLKEWQDNFK